MNANTRTANKFTLAAVGRWRYVQAVMRHRELPRRAAQAGELQELARVLGRRCLGRAQP